MSNNIRLTEKLYTIISSFVLRECCTRIIELAAIFLLFLLIINSGCKEHKPASPTPDIQVDEQFWIRILLLDNIRQCSIVIDSNFSIEEENADSKKKVKTAFKPLDKPINVQIYNSQINISDQNYVSSRIVFSPENPHIFNLNNKPYRGKVKIISNPDGTSFDVINLVPLESYIAGVAGAEMPDYWEPEALKCQVIASRTYCLFIKKRFGSNRTWDLNKTAANQVYLGIEAESPAVWKAVNETSGMILTCRQADGTESIFPSYYCSTCGGHTENSENVFGDSYEPLKGVPCTYCKNVAKPEIFFWPDVKFEIGDVNDRLMNKYPAFSRLGKIVEISTDRQSDYEEFSRLTRIKISGSNGNSEFLRAEDFRLTLDPTGRKFMSAACKFTKSDNNLIFSNGRGWGHSVGMCQCGAQGMAREGKKAKEILNYYYPDSKILKIEYNK
ncbi:MAG: SpoIID/LytB domain-containing protein [Sedimentisphaerales bacterium]|nr:SpoIID/LytB domain-containing protein [Sedimentisphaerales bacterium]